jgi:phosphoribosyl 1,2-cyclic phosphodiesterase
MAATELKHISEATTDALQEMRDLWKHFDLNKSPGAAMRITYADGEVKSHGDLFDMKAWAKKILANPKAYPDISVKMAREAME